MATGAPNPKAASCTAKMLRSADEPASVTRRQSESTRDLGGRVVVVVVIVAAVVVGVLQP